jgi:polyhydroxyalkanoate synthesis regulator phasin
MQKGDSMKRKILVAGAAALAVAGGGAAIAATQSGAPQEESKAVVDDAAKQLGITPAKLSSALKQALENRIDAAVAAGRLTKEQGDALKKRIEAEDFPMLGGFRMGFGHRGGGPGIHGFGHLDAAASYLGLTEAELGAQLAGGKTLADVAKAKGKSVDGLVSALVADEKKELDAAVKAGRITQAQADAFLANAKQRAGDLVNAKRAPRLHGRFGGPPGPLWSGRPRHRRATI